MCSGLPCAGLSYNLFVVNGLLNLWWLNPRLVDFKIVEYKVCWMKWCWMEGLLNLGVATHDIVYCEWCKFLLVLNPRLFNSKVVESILHSRWSKSPLTTSSLETQNFWNNHAISKQARINCADARTASWGQRIFCEAKIDKLDGVGPVDNRPSTD